MTPPFDKVEADIRDFNAIWEEMSDFILRSFAIPARLMPPHPYASPLVIIARSLDAVDALEKAHRSLWR